MEEYRPMATTMITNWKKIDASEDKDVDPTLYRQLIGSLMYLVNTRPNICYADNTLSQFTVEPKRVHWAAAKHVLRLGRRFSGSEKYLWVLFQHWIKMTSRCHRKQKFVALSSAEAEYMAVSTASCEAIWLRKLLVNLFRRKMEATKIMCDNQSCIKLSENLVFHDQSKHIDIWCHFVRDCVQRGAVQLSYTPTREQVAKILTKSLGRTKFDYFRQKMKMIKNPFQ
eukprot:PITA_31734